MESNFLQSQWVQRHRLFPAGTWRLNPKFKPATGRSLEYEALRGTLSWQAKQKQSLTFHCSLHVSCWQRLRLEGSLQAEKLTYFNGEDLPRQIQEIRKNVLIPAMKKIKQETPSHKATVVRDKLVVNGKFIFIMTCRRNGSLSTLQWIPRWIMAIVQPNNKNHCQGQKNPLLLWSNPKNCLVKVSGWRFFCKSNPFTEL